MFTISISTSSLIKHLFSLLGLALLTGCVSYSASNTYETKVAMIKADAKLLEKAGFLWKNNKMKGNTSYISVALSEAEKALDCQYTIAQIAKKSNPAKSAEILEGCNFKAGLEKLKIAEQFVKASKQQMKTQQFALPRYEKPRT